MQPTEEQIREAVRTLRLANFTVYRKGPERDPATWGQYVQSLREAHQKRAAERSQTMLQLAKEFYENGIGAKEAAEALGLGLGTYKAYDRALQMIGDIPSQYSWENAADRVSRAVNLHRDRGLPLLECLASEYSLSPSSRAVQIASAEIARRMGERRD